jgi:hypothetical protein
MISEIRVRVHSSVIFHLSSAMIVYIVLFMTIQIPEIYGAGPKSFRGSLLTTLKLTGFLKALMYMGNLFKYILYKDNYSLIRSLKGGGTESLGRETNRQPLYLILGTTKPNARIKQVLSHL